jgi:hypothetical protein
MASAADREPERPGAGSKALRYLAGDPSRGAPGFHLFGAVAFTLLLVLNVADAIWGEGTSWWDATKILIFLFATPMAWRTYVLARRLDRLRRCRSGRSPRRGGPAG